jgi:hypothetical protein
VRGQGGQPEGSAANPNPNVIAETDRFVDSLLDKPEHEQKQKLGERLFKVVKSFGFKNSPKITIYLLDHEELRPLGTSLFTLSPYYVNTSYSAPHGGATRSPQGKG